MATIKLDREKCIGCGSCSAVCPKYFEMADDGKARPINIEINKIECAESAAEVCPVQCIEVKK